MPTVLALLSLAFGAISGPDLFGKLGRRGPREAPYNCTSQTATGYLKNQAGQYLTCTNTNCEWQAFSETATQLFHQVPTEWRKGKPSEWDSQFQIYSPSGAPTGQCLNYWEGDEGQTPEIRMASCDLHGSKKWNICAGYLGVYNMWGCVQSNAKISRCKDSHEPVTFVSPECIVESTTIDNIQCMSPITGGGCAVTGFDAGTMAGASSQSDCNACYAAPGSTQDCSFSFAYTTQQTVTNTWSNAFTWDIGVQFQLTENFGVYGSAQQGLSFSFSDTLTVGKATSHQTTIQDTTGCSVTLPSGVRETATANYLVGTIHANFNATVTRHYRCSTGLHKTKQYVDTMKLTITNVPTQKIVGSCMTRALPCNSTTINSNGPQSRLGHLP